MEELRDKIMILIKENSFIYKVDEKDCVVLRDVNDLIAGMQELAIAYNKTEVILKLDEILHHVKP